jgi:hypothetical protein
MDALPMSEATGGTRYRAIGGEPTRRIEEILTDGVSRLQTIICVELYKLTGHIF